LIIELIGKVVGLFGGGCFDWIFWNLLGIIWGVLDGNLRDFRDPIDQSKLIGKNYKIPSQITTSYLCKSTTSSKTEQTRERNPKDGKYSNIEILNSICT
jgi:hypothetical protein